MSSTIGLIAAILSVIAWFTHLAFCFTHAAWGLLIAGALFFPIGIIHGAWLWFQ